MAPFKPTGRPKIQITGRVSVERAEQLDAIAKANNIRRPELVSQMIEYALAEIDDLGDVHQKEPLVAAAE